MNSEVLFYIIIIIFACGFSGWFWCKRRAFNQAMSRPFTPNEIQVIKKNWPIFDVLSPALQGQLAYNMKRFLYEKEFIGCAGLSVTDEIRLTIAFGASLLLLNRPHNFYPKLRWIYVYPGAFASQRDIRDENGVVTTQYKGMLGESWDNGRVVLSWYDVAEGAHDFSDGRNVVLHEFAHQLDHESGSTNGSPLHRNEEQAKLWAEVMAHEFIQLQHLVNNHQPSVIDAYGATNAAEFFAVSTETFYEKPVLLEQYHPQLFRIFCDYYCVDPRQWQTKLALH